MQNNDFRSGFVSIIGAPNSGKSTLLNALCLKKLSGVSQRPHTTRQHIKGIITRDSYQIIFIDTPGFITPKTRLEKIMHFETSRAAKDDADIILLVFEPDIEKNKKYEEVFKMYLSLKKQYIAVINKIDIYSETQIKKTQHYINSIFSVSDIILISALKKINLDKLTDKIVETLPFSPPYYYEDVLSDRWERYFAAQLIQETVFELYRDELPYSVAVSIELFKEESDPVYILAYIYVSKKTHKMIVIGKDGSMISKLRKISEEKISDFLSKNVKLELYVKIKENWQDDKNFIKKTFGYPE